MKEKMKIQLKRDGETIETNSFKVLLPNGEYLRIKYNEFGDVELTASNDKLNMYIRPVCGNQVELSFK